MQKTHTKCGNALSPQQCLLAHFCTQVYESVFLVVVKINLPESSSIVINNRRVMQLSMLSNCQNNGHSWYNSGPTLTMLASSFTEDWKPLASNWPELLALQLHVLQGLGVAHGGAPEVIVLLLRGQDSQLSSSSSPKASAATWAACTRLYGCSAVFLLAHAWCQYGIYNLTFKPANSIQPVLSPGDL